MSVYDWSSNLKGTRLSQENLSQIPSHIFLIIQQAATDHKSVCIILIRLVLHFNMILKVVSASEGLAADGAHMPLCEEVDSPQVPPIDTPVYKHSLTEGTLRPLHLLQINHLQAGDGGT